jgi:hypothetical protein
MKEQGFVPDPSLIDEYVHLARPLGSTGNILDDYATDARRCLIVLYKVQREQVKARERTSIDERLLNFVREEIRGCAEHSDPLHAIEAFVARSPRRRGRRRTPFRDLAISVDVAEGVAAGRSVDDACQETSIKRCLSFDQVRRIYFEQKKLNRIAILLRVPGWQG